MEAEEIIRLIHPRHYSKREGRFKSLAFKNSSGGRGAQKNVRGDECHMNLHGLSDRKCRSIVMAAAFCDGEHLRPLTKADTEGFVT